jgi:hypothetical protein
MLPTLRVSVSPCEAQETGIIGITHLSGSEAGPRLDRDENDGIADAARFVPRPLEGERRGHTFSHIRARGDLNGT